jgi:hypothetical protein
VIRLTDSVRALLRDKALSAASDIADEKRFHATLQERMAKLREDIHKSANYIHRLETLRAGIGLALDAEASPDPLVKAQVEP